MVNKKIGKILGEDFKQYRKDFNKAQKGIVPKVPLSVVIGTVNRCNLNCKMCYKDYHKEPKVELSAKINKKIIDECRKNKIPSITLGLDGEPLLDKNIKKTLGMLKGFDVFFSTNGTLLTDEIIKLLVDNQITRLRISLDAATPETYKKIRGFDMLKRIEDNIEKVIAYKKKRKSLLPTIRLSFVVMKDNIHEVKAFKKKWKDKVDVVDFQTFIDFKNINKLVKRKVNDFCPFPFYALTIWGNGEICPGCNWFGQQLIIGNIYKDSLMDIWNGEKIRKLREQIISKKFPLICQNCLYAKDKNLINKI